MPFTMRSLYQKRRAKTMSVHKDKDRGTWFAQVQLRDPLTGKLITKKKRGFELKREAQAWEAEIRANNQEVPSGL